MHVIGRKSAEWITKSLIKSTVQTAWFGCCKITVYIYNVLVGSTFKVGRPLCIGRDSQDFKFEKRGKLQSLAHAPKSGHGAGPPRIFFDALRSTEVLIYSHSKVILAHENAIDNYYYNFL